MTNSVSNYEFEAKVFQDIACGYNGEDTVCPGIGSMGMDENSEYCKLYDDFVYGFYIDSRDFSESDIDEYNQLGEMWNQYGGQFDDSIIPELLFYFINKKNI